MLTDAALKALKPKEKIYKIADRDGMYVRVMPSGAISFRLDYRLTVVGRPSIWGGTDATASRLLWHERSASMQDGKFGRGDLLRSRSSARSAVSRKRRALANLAAGPKADSTRAMRRSIFEREANGRGKITHQLVVAVECQISRRRRATMCVR